MTTDSEHKPEDEREEDELLARWLRPLDQDAAPPRQDVMDRVKRLGGDAFSATPADASPAQVDQAPTANSKQRRTKMLTKTVLAVAVIVGAVSLLFNPPEPAIGDVTLGSILDKTANAQSLRLKIDQDGKSFDVLMKPPGLVRWSESATKYRIASGSKLWRIDEQTNVVEEAKNPWWDQTEKQVDLLALIGMENKDAARFRESVSEGVVQHAGQTCQVFRFVTTDRKRPLQIEAFIEVQSGELQTIAAWPKGKRQGPPLAELTLVARNLPVDESKFLVAKSLSEDGRIGKVVDSQGIVTLRPPLHRRWTPIAAHVLLKPGDWLRTDVRGANASAVDLTSQFRVIAGPGSLIELQSPHRLRLHGGELKITGAESAEGSLELLGPNESKVSIAAGQSVHYRLDREGQFKKVTKPPVWLAGFEGTSSNESIGSLIAKIDGRDVPLTVGFHKVSVEIRDQIARTTIEESFVNRTNHVLEGTFHFPLPQDASISGFGMWINGELIEADVVEKQRAREIYETILREKRDPGLLEWTGGNVFKARVYPIPAASEKRIRIVYTQVLPLRANRYRYSYGLRSELLRKTPVRELSLEVQVHSALPLKSVTSPTHAVRSQLTERSAQLDFSAQEYTPERDFEVVCEVDAKQADVVVVPHRRGEDGYFLVQLTPPGAAGNWQRELLPDGKPLELLVVCDTSASMDSEKRRQQEQFVAALLAALGPRDRFNLAVCDVDCHWWRETPIEPTPERAADARKWLTDRLSLGWTDLDRMTESVLKRLNEQTHVIYVGDGIVTARDADPQAFAARLKLMTDAKRTGTFHSVSVGNSFESTVLKAVAQVGGGSVRQISGEQTPQKTAFELLNEIAQPGLRDLKVEFRGLQVAAVYPEKLPNLAAGTQQILIGRYLPQGQDQSGEIIISGERDGETVRFASRVSLNDAEAGNSFIPRLWARAHLDHLLAQGNSQAIQEQIIALSEEFHVITPYTSLLVLESDEDRERFGVKRRYQMRDGERFFADGRDNANFELLQQQMKLAGDWRLGLRRRILIELTELGRDSQLFQQLAQNLGRLAGQDDSTPMSGPVSVQSSSSRGEYFSFAGGASEPTSATMGTNLWFANESLLEKAVEGVTVWDQEEGESLELGFAIAGERLGLSDKSSLPFGEAEFDTNLSLIVRQTQTLDHPVQQGWFFERKSRSGIRSARGLDFDGGGFGGGYEGKPSSNHYVQWVHSLLPSVPPAPATPQPIKTKWTGDALAISQSLQQPIAIKAGGLEVVRDQQYHDPRWNRMTGEYRHVDLHSPQRWLSFSHSTASQTLVEWCDDKERGIFSRAFLLGQVRPAHARDLKAKTPGEREFAERALHEAFSTYEVGLERLAENRALLTLTYPEQPQTQARFLIDTQRHVLLEEEWRTNDKITRSTKYTDYVEAAGAWWPGKIEAFDEKGRRTSLTTQTVKVLPEADFAKRFMEEMPNRNQVLLLSLPLPSVREAEAAAAKGAASFEHHLILLLRSSLIQKWDEALKQLEALEQLEPGKPGLKWVRAAVLIAARRNEDARQLLTQQADKLVAGQTADDFYLAGYVRGVALDVVDHNETLRLLDRLRPVFHRQPAFVDGPREWSAHRVRSLRALGRTAEVLLLQQELARAAPWDVSAQTTYAQDLQNAGDYESAYAWLKQEIARNPERLDHQTDQLRNAYAETLRREGRDEDCVAFLEDWIAQEPASQTAYPQYLSALMLADRTKDADATAKKWLKAGQVAGQLTPEALARLNAAVSYALGDRYQISMNWIDPAWLKPLEETALFFLSHERHFDVATQIINHHRFRNFDESDRLRAEIARRLKASVDSLSERHVTSYVNWVVGRDELTLEDWRQIADALRTRWDAAKDLPNRQVLGEALVRIHARHFHDVLHLPFLRERITRAEKENLPAQVATHRQALFNELLSREWRDVYEQEALTLIEQLSPTTYGTANVPAVSERLAARIAALYRFVDRMLQARYQADLKKLQDAGHPEKLTRTELAAKQAEFQKTAREGVARRLAAHVNRQPAAPQDAEQTAGLEELFKWMQLERMTLDVRLERDLDQAANECWAMLGDAPTAMEQNETNLDDKQTEAARRRVIEQLRKQRAFALVNYLAVRKSAAPALVERLLKYVAAGLKLKDEAALSWRQSQFELLIALDKPNELERILREWIRTDDFPAFWQLALGRLLAERGKIEEAIGLFETVERSSQLSPSDYAALADWYLVVDQRDQYQQAKIDVYKNLPEHQINNWLRQQRQPWSRTDQPLPTELDENVLFAFQALFEKSNQPQNHVYELREFYTASRDFRLLKMLPDSLTGRTPQQVYPFLKQLKSGLLYEIRQEATADEILKRLKEVRTSSESAIDLRALDLLESMLERQAAEVLNQPGPHVDAAVAALQRAFERDWAEGEVRQMADLLESLGTIKQPRLSDERLRQLRELHRLTKPGTDDRLFVAWHLSRALFFSHNQREEGLRTMQIALGEYEPTHAEGWPVHANEPLDGFLGLLEAAHRFAEAEQVLTRQIAKPLNETQKLWLIQRRNQSYHAALKGDGQVSLGRGKDLYRNLEKHLLDQLKTLDNDNSRRQTVDLLLTVYETAKDKSFPFKSDLRQFAFELLPPLLQRQTNNYRQLVSQTADTLHRLIGARVALEFLIGRYEEYPKRFEYTWQNAWQQFGYRLADWHAELNRNVGDLEPRLLAIVLDELRRDLRTRDSHSRYFYHKHQGRREFWAEKAGDFARVAEEVLKERPESGRSVTYVAEYLYHGLERYRRAIEILLIAHDNKRLDTAQQIVLCDFLHSQRRHGESIPILQPIVEKHPDVMAYRTRLITAYNRSSRPEQMRQLLAETDAHFRKAGRWTESNVALLAQNCLDNKLFAESAGYYGEVIPLHQRTAPNRGIGNGTLSNYYTQQARAYSGLGQTKNAIDAAAAGVVAWGPRHAQRQNAIHGLQEVISEAKDLEDYVKQLDQEVAETGQDSPLIRQQIGIAYLTRGEHPKAITQLRAALALQPTDVETHKKLIESYDALKNLDKAVEQTLALLDVERHNLELYKKLAERLKSDDALAERAATTVVEAAPTEAEHHQALAEIREQQNRWAEAIEQWQHVARLRRLEPNGLLNLAKAQIHEKQFEAAQDSLNRLNQTEWPARFRDVRDQTQRLQQQIPASP